MNFNYVVVSPVRNEENHIEKTIESMIAQTVLPLKWIIVDDDSDDQTPQIVSRYAAAHDYIMPLRKLDLALESSDDDVPRTLGYEDRLAWAAEIRAFSYGVTFLKDYRYDFIVKLDCDLSFGPEYFERLLQEFGDNPRLGIAGGHCYEERNGKLKMERVPDAHVRGATKIYRRECYEQIGGIAEVPGWDTLDEMKAQMANWETRSFAEPKLFHLKPTGSVGGVLRGRVRHGQIAYQIGYHPLFMFCRGIRRMTERPYVIGGLAMIYGYFAAWARRLKQFDDLELRKYIRNQQMQRLFSWRLSD